MRPYTPQSSAPPVSGRPVVYRPVVQITIVGPSAQQDRLILLDSGSDDVVFPLGLAVALGVNLNPTVHHQARGVGAVQPVPLFPGPVILEFNDGTSSARWRTDVTFTSGAPRIPIFGSVGGLEYFRTTLDYVRQEITLEPQPTLPSTSDRVP
jgi:hypothetical protein